MTNNTVSLRDSHSRHENDTPLRHRFCNMYSVTLLWHKNVRENVQLIQGFSLASFRIFLGNSILLHSGLNPAWHFWLSTKFSCCLKMKSVENILGYIREQFWKQNTISQENSKAGKGKTLNQLHIFANIFMSQQRHRIHIAKSMT